MTDFAQQRYDKAEKALRDDIKKYGSESAQWVLNAKPADFYSVWGEEIKTLAAEGSVEINMYHTATYRPVTVTIDNPLTAIRETFDKKLITLDEAVAEAVKAGASPADLADSFDKIELAEIVHSLKTDGGN